MDSSSPFWLRINHDRSIHQPDSLLHTRKTQTLALRLLYAGRRGWTIAAEYIDQGVSGSKESRPAL